MRCLTARLTARCSIRLMSGSDDASPRRPATTGPPEGRPLDKIIRTELTEEAEGENEEAQGEAAGGGAGLPLELPDVIYVSHTGWPEQVSSLILLMILVH